MRLDLYTVELTSLGGTKRPVHFIAPAGMHLMRARGNRISGYFLNLENAQQTLVELQSQYDDADAAG